MTEPRRLLEELSELEHPHAPFARSMLETARTDAAPAGAEERALAALGLGLAASTSIAPAAPAAQMLANAGAPSVTGVTGASVLVKWVGIAVFALAAAAGSYRILASTATTSAGAMPPNASSIAARAPVTMKVAKSDQAQPAVANVAAVASTAANQDVIEIEDPRAPVADKAPLVALQAPGASLGTQAPAPAASASLGAELSVLDTARQAIKVRDAAGANAALDEYARKFPRGTMREEAAVARVEALLVAGDPSAAEAKADEFLRDRAGSAYAARVQSLKKRAIQEEALKGQ